MTPYPFGNGSIAYPTATISASGTGTAGAGASVVPFTGGAGKAAAKGGLWGVVVVAAVGVVMVGAIA